MIKAALKLIALAEKCKLLPQNIRLFHQLAENERSGKWYHVVRVIHRLINFQESKRAGRCVVNSGVDEDLDRRTFHYYFLILFEIFIMD